MRRFAAPLALLAFASLSVACREDAATAHTSHAASGPSSSPPAQPRDVLASVPAWLEETGVPAVAIGVIEEGQVAWTASYGQREGDDRFDDDTLFNLASLTKPVFATMVLHQIAQGHAALDGPIADFYTDDSFAEDSRQALLTPRFVLSHQTGLPNWRTRREMRFTFDPGARFGYSGEAYEYLARALAATRSIPSPRLVEAEVLTRAAMRNSFLGWRDGLEHRFAFGVDEPPEDEPPEFVDPWMRQDGIRSGFAAAGMVSTVEDYARFLAWVARGADLPSDLFEAMATPQTAIGPGIGWGLGWGVLDADGETVLYHGGGEDGVATYAALFVESRRGIVILTNASFGDPLIHTIAERVLDGARAIHSRLAWLEMVLLEAFWNRIDVTRLDRSEQDEHFHEISGNPNKLPVLLLTTKTFALDRAGLDDAERQAARAVIDRLLAEWAADGLESAETAALSSHLATPFPFGDFWRVRTDLDAEALRRFVKQAAASVADDRP